MRELLCQSEDESERDLPTVGHRGSLRAASPHQRLSIPGQEPYRNTTSCGDEALETYRKPIGNLWEIGNQSKPRGSQKILASKSRTGGQSFSRRLRRGATGAHASSARRPRQEATAAGWPLGPSFGLAKALK